MLIKRETKRQKEIFSRASRDLYCENKPYKLKRSIECFHMTSRRPSWGPETKKRQPCWWPQLILWELNSIFKQTISFLLVKKHAPLLRLYYISKLSFLIYLNCSIRTAILIVHKSVTQILQHSSRRQSFLLLFLSTFAKAKNKGVNSLFMHSTDSDIQYKTTQ